MNTNDENETNNINTNVPIINSNNNENNLNLNKEKNLPENKNEIKLDEKEENNQNISTENNKNENKNNNLSNINWGKIAEKLENKNARQCQTRWQNILDPNRVKGPWTKEEDNKLIELVKENGAQKWSYISSFLPGRLGKQCRERWYNHLNPEVRKTGWSKEEEWVLFLLHRKYGNSWSTFNKKIPGRTDNTIKNHWNSIMKKNIVGINNQYQEMIKGKTKEEIEEIEKTIMDKCYQKMNKDYNEYYQEKLKSCPMMQLINHSKKDKDKNKENENNINNNDNENNSISKTNSLDNILNSITIKTPTKNKKKIFENIKISEKNKRNSTIAKSKNRKSTSKNENKKTKQISENKKNNTSKKNSKYFNIIDDNELKLIKSGEKILQKDKNILIKEAENKYKEKQKIKKGEKKSKSVTNKHYKKEEENEYNIKKMAKLNAFSNKKTAKKSKRKKNKNKSKKIEKTKFNVSKFSIRKEKESPNINNLNNKKININNINNINNSNSNNNYINNSNIHNFINNSDYPVNNNFIPFPIYSIEKLPYYMGEEKDNFNKILISDYKDINKQKKEQQFPFKIPTTSPFCHTDMKYSSDSSGGNNSSGKMPFMPSTDKFSLFNRQNIPQNQGIYFNNTQKLSRFPNLEENNNNNNNNKSTNSNSVHSYSMISDNSAFKKSSSSSGSDPRRNFQPRIGAFNFNNTTDLNKQFFSNMNNKM